MPPPALGRLFALNLPELPVFVVGVIAAMLQGAIFPSLAVLFAAVLGVRAYTYCLNYKHCATDDLLCVLHFETRHYVMYM